MVTKRGGSMKTLNHKKSVAIALGLLMGATASTALFAQQDPLLADIDQNVLNQEQIDVDGKFQRPSAADKLEAARKQLERQNQQMVHKKIEDIRTANEMKLTKQLQRAFNGGLKSPVVDTVSTSQAAVVKAEVKSSEANKEMRIAPVIGYSAITGKSTIGETMDFASKIDVGLAFDADVHDRVSVGVALGYQALDITDFNSSTYSNQFYSTYGTNTSWYTGLYGSGRVLNSKTLSLDITSRVYATIKDARFRPYLGLGVGFKHLLLKYNNNTTVYDPYSIAYGEEEFSANYITGSAALGALVNFSSTIGMNVEISYTKGISSSFSENSAQTARNIDQLRLNQIGGGMSKADVTAVKAGLTIGF